MALRERSFMPGLPRGDREAAKLYCLSHERIGRGTPAPPRLDHRRLRYGRGQGRLHRASDRRIPRSRGDHASRRPERRLRARRQSAGRRDGDRRRDQGRRRRSRRDPWRVGARHGAAGRSRKRRSVQGWAWRRHRDLAGPAGAAGRARDQPGAAQDDAGGDRRKLRARSDATAMSRSRSPSRMARRWRRRR